MPTFCTHATCILCEIFFTYLPQMTAIFFQIYRVHIVYHNETHICCICMYMFCRDCIIIKNKKKIELIFFFFQFFFSNHTTFILVKSCREINAVSENVYFCILIHGSFHSATIYRYLPLVIVSFAPETWSSKG